jgi:hypothetical protein
VTIALALSYAAWILSNAFLLLGIAGTAFGDSELGTMLWAGTGFAALLCGLNAWVLQSLNHLFGF